MEKETDYCRKCGAPAEYFNPEIGSVCARCGNMEGRDKARTVNNAAIKTERDSSSELGAVSWVDALIATLRAQADEIAREGHAGWGNTMTLAADTLEKLKSDMGSASTVLMSDGANNER